MKPRSPRQTAAPATATDGAATPRRRHSVTLDMVRAAAALMIILFHYTSAYNLNGYNTGIYATDWGWNVWWGYAAVTTFFMLSGYLAATYITAPEPAPKRFLVKKLRRFYPVYWAAMTLTAIVLYFFFAEESPGWTGWLANLTMVSRLFGVPFVDGAYWTMQVELIFCLIAILLMYFGRRRRLTAALAVWLVLSIVLALTRDVKALKFLRIISICNYSHCFVAGIVIWRSTRVNGRRITPAAMLLLVLALTNSIAWTGAFSPDTILFAVTAAILLMLNRLDRLICGDSLIVRALAWIAAISYPLYLLQEMTGFAIIRHMQGAGWTSPLCILVPLAVCMAAAWLLHRYVEKRF